MRDTCPACICELLYGKRRRRRHGNVGPAAEAAIHPPLSVVIFVRLVSSERRLIIGKLTNYRRRRVPSRPPLSTIALLSRAASPLIDRWRPPRHDSRQVSAICVKLHLRDGRTDGRTKRRVSLSVVSVRGVYPMGEDEPRCLRRNLRGNSDQPINTRNLASWLSGKSFKYCYQVQMPHFKAKMHLIRFSASVRPFVSSFDTIFGTVVMKMNEPVNE